MTFQPPPPPPGTPPAFNNPGGPQGFDPKAVNPLDWGILGAGVLAFIFSLFDYYTISVSYKGVSGFGGANASASASAWHGFFGWAAAILAIAGAAAVAITLFAPQVKLPVPARLAGLGLFVIALLFVILALFVFPGGDTSDASALGVNIDEGHGLGYWVSLIVIAAGAVLSLMRLQATGGKLPGALANMPNIGGYGPQGGISGSGGPTPGGNFGNPGNPGPATRHRLRRVTRRRPLRRVTPRPRRRLRRAIHRRLLRRVTRRPRRRLRRVTRRRRPVRAISRPGPDRPQLGWLISARTVPGHASRVPARARLRPIRSRHGYGLGCMR